MPDVGPVVISAFLQMRHDDWTRHLWSFLKYVCVKYTKLFEESLDHISSLPRPKALNRLHYSCRPCLWKVLQQFPNVSTSQRKLMTKPACKF